MLGSVIGVGSSVFHPEASRVAFLASGGRRSFAQAIFQLGGEFLAQALAPSVGDIVVIEQKSNRWESCRRESSKVILIWFASFSIFCDVQSCLLIGKWRSILLKLLKKKVKKP